jgi:release factor glutamine methyltransferase
MRVADVLSWGASELLQAGVEEYELDARLLLEHVLDKTRTALLLEAASVVSGEKLNTYRAMISQRAERKPVAYILGEQEFWSLSFIVTPDVLIPRPETEFLLEQVLKRVNPANIQSGKIVDLCCGSGVIATVLAKETGKAILALDISEKALAVTRKNACRHGVDDNVFLVQGDLLSSIQNGEKLSLVVSNPPYVRHLDVTENLEPEVSDYEPHLALDGGAEGLDLIVRIREQLEQRLASGGELFMEIGADQGKAVQELFSRHDGTSRGYGSVEILNDYAGRNRVVHAVKN